MAPPDIICIKVRKGKASARLASATVPNCPTYQASAKVIAVIIATAMTFGVASRQRTLAGPASSRNCAPDVLALDKLFSFRLSSESALGVFERFHAFVHWQLGGAWHAAI